MFEDKTILEKFVKSFFRNENFLPYSYISQYGQGLILENKSKKLNREIFTLLKKYLKIRFKKLEISKTVKRKKEIGVVQKIIDEYIWLYRMLSTFRKIFFICDFTKFYKKINEKINLIVKNSQEDLIEELSSIILEYELMKDDPKYAVRFTKSDKLFDYSREKEFSKFEYIVLAFELLKNNEEITSKIENEFVDSWIRNAVTCIENLAGLDLRISSLRKNILLEEHIHNIEKEIIKKIFSKISLNYLLTCIGNRKDIQSIEYYYELIDEKEKYEQIVFNYLNVRYSILDKKSINLEKVKQLKKELEEKNKSSLTIEKLNSLITSDLFRENILILKDQQKFILLFSFWLETLACKSSETSFSELINSGFEKFVNKDELNVIRYVTCSVNDILTNKTKVIDYFTGVAQRELGNLESLFYEISLFDNQDLKDKLLCPYLLCPTDIVLNEFSNNLDNEDRNSFLKRSLYKFVGDIFNIIKDKDTFEKYLREKLSLRLFAESSSIQDEEEFISCLKLNINKTVYSKLETILSDFRERIIFKNSEITLLRRFQWPDFKTLSVKFEELDKLKNEYSQNLLLNERKSVKWLDTLSTCDIEIDQKPFRISLIQYKILMNLCDGQSVFEENMTEEEQDIYKIHLKELINKKLLVQNGKSYIINYKAPESDCVPRQVFLKGLSKDQNVEDCDKFEKAILDCQIMKVLKARKNITIEDLRQIIDCDLNLLNGRVEECRKKGYLDVSGNFVTYVP